MVVKNNYPTVTQVSQLMNNGLCEFDLCLIRQNLTCDVSTHNLNSFESFAEPNSTGLAIKKLGVCYLS